MSTYIQTDGYAANDSAWKGDYTLKGPQILSPYLMVSSFTNHSNGSDSNYMVPPTEDSSLTRKSSEDATSIVTTQADKNNINLKRSAIFVAPVKLLNDEGTEQNIPADDTLYSEKAREYDDGKYIYSDKLLLKMDTLDLYEGDASNLGDLQGSAGAFYNLESYPSPVRGLPLKFRKIYFYGAQSREDPPPKDLRWSAMQYPNAAERSDGRGALFSMWVLGADPVNISCKYGDPRDAIETVWGVPESDTLEATFTEAYEDQFAYDEDTQWFRTDSCQYHEGVGWNDTASNGNDPLIIGNGAFGYNDVSLGGVLRSREIINPTYALSTVYYKTKVKVCIENNDGDKTGVEGYIPFQPIEEHRSAFNSYLYEEDREILPLVYDVRSQVLYEEGVASGSMTASGLDMLGFEQTPLANEAPKIGSGTKGLDQIYNEAGIRKSTVTGLKGFHDNCKILYQPYKNPADSAPVCGE